MFKNNFHLSRGPYDIVSVMDESVNNEPYTVRGLLIDLFDPLLPVLTEKKIEPGKQAFLFNITRIEDMQQPQVLASASRIYNENSTKNSYSFIVKSPSETTNSMRVLLPAAPTEISIIDNVKQKIENYKTNWDEESKTCWFEFENSPEGVMVEIEW